MDFLGFRWLSLVALLGVIVAGVAYVGWGILAGRLHDDHDPGAAEDL